MSKKLAMKPKECLWCKVNPPKRKVKDKFSIIALDRPYVNLWFHRRCLNKLSEEELLKFLNENKKIWDKNP